MATRAVCPHCGAAVPAFATSGDRCQFCGRELRLGPGGDIAFLRIQQQLQRLERRIGTIEERLGIPEPAAERPRGEALVPPPIRAAATPAASAAAPAILELVPAVDAPPQPATAGPPEPILLRAPAAPAHSPGLSLQGPVPTGWEQTIGLKWAAWVGAVVLVIGAGLGIKFAYDQGWLGNLSPTTRLLLLSLVGFGLMLAGEVVYRRVNIISAAGLFGAGVGVLFLVSYAGNVYYQVYSYEVAFVFVAFTTVVGSAVAMRAQMVSVAVLAQIGGNVAPFVLSTGEPPGLAFFTYLLMLQVVALSLALWGNSPKWWILRGQSLATTAFWVFSALRTEEALRGLHDESFWFSLLYAMAFQRELIWSAVRIRQAEDAAEVVPPRELLAGWGVMFSMLVTAGVTAAILFILKDYPDLVRGGWVLGLAAIFAALGFTLGGDNVRLKVLADGFQVQSAALTVLFVPVTFTGVWISLAWAILSAAFAVLGARYGRQMAKGTALVAWLLSVIALVTETAGTTADTGARAVWLNLLATELRAYLFLGWLLAIAGHVVAWLLEKNPIGVEAEPEGRWRVVAGAATGVWAVAALTGLPPMGATLALVVGVWLLAAVSFLPDRLELAVHAVWLLAFAALKWLAADTLVTRVDPGWDALRYVPVLNPAMGLGVLLAATLVVVYRLRREAISRFLTARWRGERPGLSVPVVLGGAILLVTFALSFEVDRLVERLSALGYPLGWPVAQLKSLMLTVLWACVLLACAARAGLQSRAVLVMALALVAVKFLALDTLFFRIDRGVADVVVLLNWQLAAAGAIVAAMILLRRKSASPERALDLLAVLIGLWVGTLEIDRLFTHTLGQALTDPRLAKLIAISIFWSLYAVGLIVLGFRFRFAGLRYFGLGLFALTLAKVALFDLSRVEHGYRILSTLGLGLLLLGTSVLYGKLSPRLLARREADAEPVRPAGPQAD